MVDGLSGTDFLKLVASGGAMVLLAGYLLMQYLLVLKLGPSILAAWNALVARIASMEAKLDADIALRARDSIITGQHKAVSVADAEALTNGKKP